MPAFGESTRRAAAVLRFNRFDAVSLQTVGNESRFRMPPLAIRIFPHILKGCHRKRAFTPNFLKFPFIFRKGSFHGNPAACSVLHQQIAFPNIYDDVFP